MITPAIMNRGFRLRSLKVFSGSIKIVPKVPISDI